MTKDKSAYAASGVSIAAQDEALAQVKKLARVDLHARRALRHRLFGGLFRPDLAGIEEPVLVASADGVGTKLEVAQHGRRFSTRSAATW